MKKLTAALPVLLFHFAMQSQVVSPETETVQRPRLVVGLVVDQMRWDYLYRYYDRYAANGGFKRLLKTGFSCENTMIPYTPTVTASGHSCIYTGTVPAISGITGNYWWDRQQMRSVYCTEDKNVNTVGSASSSGKMSPKNMMVTSICDELRIATNFKSKVIGLSLKDRGGILPAGHNANAAYWFDNSTGSWISSTWYMNELPKWVTDFNNSKSVDKYFEEGWSLMYPAHTYIQSTEDEKPYEAKPFGPKFPYDLKKFIGKDFSKIAATPMGNSLTNEFAKAAITGEQLGTDNITDFLAISFSSPDYIGHTFGPNSVESEDGFLRLDNEIANLLDFLDAKVGKNQYTVFLTADHGVAHIPEYMQENKLPAGRVYMNTLVNQLNKSLFEKYKSEDIIVSDDNYQLHLDQSKIESLKIAKKEITGWIINKLSADSGIARIFAIEDLNIVPLPEVIRNLLNNGYYPARNGDIQLIFKPGYIDALAGVGTTHGLWNPYDSHIPLVWYGWGIKTGKSNREVYMTDIAPTIAALLHIQMPNGCIGKPIEELIR